MDKKYDFLGIMLAVVTGSMLLAAMLIRAFLPRMILPNLDGPNLVLLSLTALVLEHYLAKNSRRDYRFLPLYGALIFGLFPWAACFIGGMSACKLAVTGAVIFTVITFLFDSMMDRLSSGPAAKLAPIAGAFGLYLAAQGLMGII